MTHSTGPPKPPAILVVEDDGLIRRHAAEAFDDAGFIVFEAGDAANALQILGVSGPRIDALFTDVNMPGAMTGLSLARHAHDHWPWMRLAVTSGFVRPAVAAMPESARFFPKPYDVNCVVDYFRSATLAAASPVERRRV